MPRRLAKSSSSPLIKADTADMADEIEFYPASATLRQYPLLNDLAHTGSESRKLRDQPKEGRDKVEWKECVTTIENLRLHFNSAAAAEADLLRPLPGVEQRRLNFTSHQKQERVKRLICAVRNVPPNYPKVQLNLVQVNTGIVSDKLVEMRMWQFFERMQARWEQGVLTVSWLEKDVRKSEAFEDFDAYFDYMCNMVYSVKDLGYRALKDNTIDELLDHPRDAYNRHENNVKVNNRKADQLKLGQEAMKKRAASDDNNQGQAPPTKRANRRSALVESAVQQFPEAELSYDMAEQALLPPLVQSHDHQALQPAERHMRRASVLDQTFGNEQADQNSHSNNSLRPHAEYSNSNTDFAASYPMNAFQQFPFTSFHSHQEPSQPSANYDLQPSALPAGHDFNQDQLAWMQLFSQPNGPYTAQQAAADQHTPQSSPSPLPSGQTHYPTPPHRNISDPLPSNPLHNVRVPTTAPPGYSGRTHMSSTPGGMSRRTSSAMPAVGSWPTAYASGDFPLPSGNDGFSTSRRAVEASRGEGPETSSYEGGTGAGLVQAQPVNCDDWLTNYDGFSELRQ